MGNIVGVSAITSTGKLAHDWRYLGFDECNYALHPAGETLLREFGRLPDAPYGIRVHHLFCTGNLGGSRKWGSTNVYREDGDGNPVLDWTTIDAIIDVILSSGNVPFLELGFMPLDLAKPQSAGDGTTHNQYALYRQRGWASPPKDVNAWGYLIEQFAQHCADRYGAPGAASWYWELWNEPDLGYYWNGSLSDYCDLFDVTESSLHRILPEARFGGPATTGPAEGSRSLEFLSGFLDHCMDHTRLDFVSFHAKGGGFPFDPHAEKGYPSLERLLQQIDTGINAVAAAGFSDREIIISEADPDGWAAGGMYDNPNLAFRNTEYYASYVFAAYTGMLERSEAIGQPIKPLAWAFMFPDDRCFEGTRVFTTQGIHKPIYRLFELLAMTGTERLKTESLPRVCCLASRTPDGNTMVMVSRHQDDPENGDAQEIVVQVCDLVENARYSLGRSIIDSKHTAPVSAWEEAGCPDFPVGEAYETIRRMDALHKGGEQELTSTDDGVARITVELEPHSVVALTLVHQTR